MTRDEREILINKLVDDEVFTTPQDTILQFYAEYIYRVFSKLTDKQLLNMRG